MSESTASRPSKGEPSVCTMCDREQSLFTLAQQTPLNHLAFYFLILLRRVQAARV